VNLLTIGELPVSGLGGASDLAGSCEQGNENLCPKIAKQFLELHNDYQLLKEDSGQRSHLVSLAGPVN
jgi:hypothetical protein